MQIDPIHIDGTTYNLTLDDVREYIVKDINNLQQRDLLVQGGGGVWRRGYRLDGSIGGYHAAGGRKYPRNHASIYE